MIGSREGWEYGVLKTTAGFTTFTAVIAGYFARSASNQEAISKELSSKNMPDSKFAYELQKRLLIANVKSGVTFGVRMALFPITFCAITLSSISYRNDVHPLDMALCYGTAGGLLGLRGGAKTMAIASVGAAAFGLSSGLLLIYLLNRSDISIPDARHHFSMEHKASVEYEKMLATMRERDAGYRRSLVEQELKQKEEKKKSS